MIPKTSLDRSLLNSRHFPYSFSDNEDVHVNLDDDEEEEEESGSDTSSDSGDDFEQGRPESADDEGEEEEDEENGVKGKDDDEDDEDEDSSQKEEEVKINARGSLESFLLEQWSRGPVHVNFFLFMRTQFIRTSAGEMANI